MSNDRYTFSPLDYGQFSVKINEINLNTANTLRRIMLDHIPTMRIFAIEWVKNNTKTSDEIISFRLTTIPIKADLKKYVTQQKCECLTTEAFGCKKCGEWFTLNYTAKRNGEIVRSGNLVPDSDDVEIVMKKIRIQKLLKDQVLECRAFARIGFGSENLVFSPVSAVTFKDLGRNRFEFIIEPKADDMTVTEIMDNALARLPLFDPAYKEIPISESIANLLETKFSELLIANDEDEDEFSIVSCSEKPEEAQDAD